MHLISFIFNQIDIEKICKELSVYEGGTIDLTKDETTGVAIMVINNPTRKNSFTGAMMVKLRQVLDELEQWTTGKALIIHGAGKFTFLIKKLIKILKYLNIMYL